MNLCITLTNRIIKNGIIFPSFIVLIISLGSGLQYSDSQSTNQDSNVASITTVGLGDQPTIKQDEEQTDQGEIENETVTDEGELENETITQEDNQTAPNRLVPKFGAGHIAPDLTAPTVTTIPTFFNIKITFKGITIGQDLDPIGAGCGEWDLDVFVQGKLVQLSDASGTPEHPTRLWHVCDGESILSPGDLSTDVYFKPGTEITVDIPVDPGGARESQPLSIFTVGVEVDNCGEVTWPSQLENVQKILTEKAPTRPYYAAATANVILTKIADIQKHMQEAGRVGDEICGDINKNDIIYGVNSLTSPASLIKVPAGTYDRPESVDRSVCGGNLCLSYTINCPTCPVTRVHTPGQQQVPPP